MVCGMNASHNMNPGEGQVQAYLVKQKMQQVVAINTEQKTNTEVQWYDVSGG